MSPAETIIYLFVLLTAVAGVFITRKLSIKKVEALMRANSESALAATLTGKPPLEVLPGDAINFIEINSASVIDDAVKQRELLITRARKLFWKVALIDMAAGAGYILVCTVAYLLTNAAKSDDWMGGVGFGIILILLSLDRYLSFRSQFRAYQTGFYRFLNPVIRFRAFYNKPRYSIYYSGTVILMLLLVAISSTDFPWQIRWGLVIAVAFHIFLMARLYISYRDIRNYKLLILRVFDIDKNAKFTFNGLWKYWQHFGSFFTVADRSYLSRQIKIWRQLILLLVFIYLTTLMLHSEFFKMSYTDSGITILVILLIGLYLNILYNYRQIKRSFISSREVLDKRLERIKRWPRKLSNTFKEVPVKCYENTWKMAVSEFVQMADTILMDLRGFSEERRGCTTEVNLLLDCVPAGRVTFLVGPDDLEHVKKMIQEAWQSISSTSPNLQTQNPDVTLYVAQKKDSKDIQGIMDILLNATSYAPVGTVAG